MIDASGIYPDSRQLMRARIAVSLGFFIFGIGFALWAVHIPVIAARLNLDPAILGLALLNVGLGGVVSQPITGWMIARTSSRPAAMALLPVFLITFIAPIVAWSTLIFFAATLILGLAAGACNVAINTQASEIEKARGKPTMSSFHGFFSLGALAGAVLGGTIIAVGWQNGSGAVAVAGIMLGVAVFIVRHFLAAPAAQSGEAGGQNKEYAWPSLAVLGLSVLTFFSNTVEGAVNDWSALYLSTVRGFSNAEAASGFAAFSLAMAVCRLAGGTVVARLGEKRIVLFGGLLMAIGMAVVLLSPWAILSPCGFALVAIGAANTIPVMMGAASRAPGMSASTGIAATATAALLGFLIGPPVIGFIAHAMGLTAALGFLTLAGLVIAIGAALYDWPSRA